MELYDENEGQVIQENHDLQIQLLFFDLTFNYYG